MIKLKFWASRHDNRYSVADLKLSRISKMAHFMKRDNSWKRLTVFVKRSIVDVRVGSQYPSAIRITQNKTKFEYTKEYFVSEGLLNI